MLLLAGLVCILATGCRGTTAAADPLRVGWISDLHFNPFHDPAVAKQLAAAPAAQWDGILAASGPNARLPAIGDETNRSLLESTLAALREDQAEPAFLVFTGDFLPYQFRENYIRLTGDPSEAGFRQFTDRTLAYLVSRLRRHFPATAIYFCLGNNDSYEGDYQQTANGPFLKNTAPLFADRLLADDANRRRLRTDYPAFGNYLVILPGMPNRGLIILDANMMSPRYTGGDAAGLAQLDWLEARLNANPDGQFWILMHIPPGVDVFATLNANPGQGRVGPVTTFFTPAHQARLFDILRRHAGQIKLVLAGHIHRDDFRLIPWPAGTAQPRTVVQINTAVAPVYGNNPALKILTVDPRTLALLDYRVRSLDLVHGRTQWQDSYTFSTTYPQAATSNPDGMQILWDMIQPGTPESGNFAKRQVTGGQPEITPGNANSYWQGMRCLDPDEWRQKINLPTVPLSVPPGRHE